MEVPPWPQGGVGTHSQSWKSHPTQDSSRSFEFSPPPPLAIHIKKTGKF